MKHSEAAKIIRNLLSCVQKARSNLAELFNIPTAELDQHDMHVLMNPWLCGERTIITPLLSRIDLLDAGGEVGPIDLYNLLVIVDRHLPQVDMLYLLKTGTVLPDISSAPKWVGGWEPKSDS